MSTSRGGSTPHASALHAATRWVVLVVVTAGLTLAGGWALGAWDLPRMVMHVAGRLPVDDGAARSRPPRKPAWTGTRGTEVCHVCRTRREVHLENGELTVLDERPAERTAWLLASVPGHEHAWSREGCWITQTEDSWSEALRATSAIADDEWFAFLRSLHDDERAAVVERRHPDPYARFDAWKATSPDGPSASPPR